LLCGFSVPIKRLKQNVGVCAISSREQTLKLEPYYNYIFVAYVTSFRDFYDYND